jgi:hypothetical protein
MAFNSTFSQVAITFGLNLRGTRDKKKRKELSREREKKIKQRERKQ